MTFRFIHDVPDILNSYIMVVNDNYDMTDPGKKKGKAFEREVNYISNNNCEMVEDFVESRGKTDRMPWTFKRFLAHFCPFRRRQRCEQRDRSR